MIPYSRQNISFGDVLSVVKALKSSHLTQGPQVPRFEEAVCRYTGSKYGVAVNSATSALHIACLALGIGPGDSVWTTSISFVASANCAIFCGAKVDFVDIDKDSWNLSLEHLKNKLEAARGSGALPKALVVVHLGGLPAQMVEIRALSKQYGFHVVEDASQALGARIGEERVGGCQWSDIAVFSFHAVKNITTGEGGIAVTNNRSLAMKMSLIRSHGITRNPADYQRADASSAPWYYEQVDLGFNYRLTDFQAALGFSQIVKIEKFNLVRRRILAYYTRELESFEGIALQSIDPTFTTSAHLAIVRFKNGLLRDKVAYALRAKGYGTALHYPPIHKQPFYERLMVRQLAEAENYAEQALSLPCHPRLRLRQAKEVVKIIRDTVLDNI